MAAAAGDLGLLEHLVGDGVLARGLDRFFGQLVTELALAPPLVELDVCEVAEVTGGQAHLEFFLLGLMLVTRSAVYLLALDLVLLLKVRFVDKVDLLFAQLDFFGLELVIRLAMAVGSHAAGVDDPWSRVDRIPAEPDVGEAVRWLFGDMLVLGRGTCRLGLTPHLGPLGRVMTIHAAVFVVFVLFPKLVGFLNDIRVGQNVTVAAEELGLGGIRLRKLGLELHHLFRAQRRGD